MASVVHEEKFIRTSIDDPFSIEKTQRWNFMRPFYQPTLSGTEEIVNERKHWSDYIDVEDEKTLQFKIKTEERVNIFFSLIEKIEYAEFITWDQIFARENELRPDLKLIFNQNKYLYPIENPLRTRTGPPYNPFSLTLTGRLTYKTFEEFHTCYNKCVENTDCWFIDEIRNDQYFERLLIDNVEYDYPFLSNRIRAT